MFLASCNHQEGWVGLAEIQAKQYGQLADLILGYIPRYAQQEQTYSMALSLKYLAKHHFSVSQNWHWYILSPVRCYTRYITCKGEAMINKF